ncbi:MAG: hybrid sensor histidine kinase/response regulator [Gallionella sp.]|nr:hybrid sensor histidine kinase/response regulator [Gallionella sp.]
MIALSQILRFDIDETNLPIRREQVRARIAMYPTMLGSQLMLAPLLVLMMWDVISHAVLLEWLVLACVVNLLELFQWGRTRKLTDGIEDCRAWDARFKYFTFAASITWGAGWVVMFVPGDLGYQALLICVAMGMSAGAVTINPVHRPSLFIYLAGLLLPLVISVAMEADGTHWILAVMLLTYVVFLMNSGIKLMLTFETSLMQRFENEALLQILRTREGEIAEALNVAEQANRSKSKFLATASHDLRQPLQALRLFTEALQNVAKEPESLRLAGQIGKSVNALVDMFDDLLDVSRLDAGIIQPRWQHFELLDLFDRLFVDFDSLAKAKGLVLELPYCNDKGINEAYCNAIVYSDPFLLERMMRNLISNAIRYTDQGGVAVRCRCLPGEVEISVKDTGIGIRPEVLSHIFEEYYQVDNPHRDRRKGLGLGLAIVRRVEELLGYRVEVESTPGQGSTFRFALKQGDASMLARPYVITQSRQDVSNKVIALVEDDADIREFTVEIMQEWGCRVFAGESGADVLRELDKAALRPDLLVCDFRLPNNQTALDVMKQMREFWGEMPVLVVTGDTAAETLQAIQKSGAMLLHKPIAPNRLRSMMFLAMQGAATIQ